MVFSFDGYLRRFHLLLLILLFNGLSHGFQRYTRPLHTSLQHYKAEYVRSRYNPKAVKTNTPGNLKCINSRRSLQMSILGPVRYTTGDWLDCIATLPTSRILARTKYYIMFYTAWTAFIVAYYKVKQITVTLPPSVHSVLGSALGLLLVFRTNTSYDRFWEARKCWGSIIIASRDIAKLSCNHLDRKYHRKIAGILVSFSIALKQHLQGDRDAEAFKPYLECPESILIMNRMRNRPLYLLSELDRVIFKGLSDMYHQSSNLSTQPKYMEKGFHDSCSLLNVQLGCCERIVKQPVPLSYSRHTSRFLSLYMATLPFSLVPYLGWLTVPVLSAICWSFVSIQEIGHFIEEPFNKMTQVIPLNQLVSVIRVDISEIFDGLLDNPLIDESEGIMLQETISNSRRSKDDNYFSYYANPI